MDTNKLIEIAQKAGLNDIIDESVTQGEYEDAVNDFVFLISKERHDMIGSFNEWSMRTFSNDNKRPTVFEAFSAGFEKAKCGKQGE